MHKLGVVVDSCIMKRAHSIDIMCTNPNSTTNGDSQGARHHQKPVAFTAIPIPHSVTSRTDYSETPVYYLLLIIISRVVVIKSWVEIIIIFRLPFTPDLDSGFVERVKRHPCLLDQLVVTVALPLDIETSDEEVQAQLQDLEWVVIGDDPEDADEVVALRQDVTEEPVDQLRRLLVEAREVDVLRITTVMILLIELQTDRVFNN